MAKELICNGANPRGVAFFGYVPVDIAAHKGNREMIEMILQSCVGDNNGKFVDELIHLGSKMIMPYDQHFYTLLKHLILENNNFSEELFEFLLKIGARVEAKNEVGETPLHLAALHGNEKAIKLLAEKGVEMDPIFVYCTNCRFTPLHLAIYKGHNGSVKLLLEKGADISARINFSEISSIDLASSLGHVDIVDTLIRHSLLSSSALSEFLSSELVPDISTLSKELVELGKHNPKQPLACEAAKTNKPHLIELVELLGGFIGKEELNNKGNIINEEGNVGILFPVKPFVYEIPHSLQQSDYPIIAAVKSGSAEAVKVLLSKGVNTRIKCKFESFEYQEKFSLTDLAIYSEKC